MIISLRVSDELYAIYGKRDPMHPQKAMEQALVDALTAEEKVALFVHASRGKPE